MLSFLPFCKFITSPFPPCSLIQIVKEEEAARNANRVTLQRPVGGPPPPPPGAARGACIMCALFCSSF